MWPFFRGPLPEIAASFTAPRQRVENSWGAQWGDGGFVNLSWDFIDSSEIGDFNVVSDLAK